VERLKKWGFGPIDCQMMNSHIATLGAIPISREDFTGILEKFLNAGETRKGPWTE
jgi:Leu/Phe-tRNA-protein transferase